VNDAFLQALAGGVRDVKGAALATSGMTSEVRVVAGAPPSVRGEVCVIKMHKRDAEVKVGIELGYSQDGRWLVVAKIVPGTLGATHGELKPGGKLVEITANGEQHKQPSLQEAIVLIGGAVGDLVLTIMPLLDRYGFIVSTSEFIANPITREMVRQENSQLRKWQKRAATPQAWQSYAERKPGKLRARIRLGVPEAVRGFVWKLMAAGRAPVDFRSEGKYAALVAKETGPHTEYFAQIEKDVPRTMTEHIFFRTVGKTGQESLSRVLRAYAAFHPELGYTQGMSSYAAVLLLYMTEEDAFWTFATIMQPCGLVGLFVDGFPYVHQCYDTWQALLAKHLPRLNTHITREVLGFLCMSEAEFKQAVKSKDPQRSIVPSMYTTYWFQSMLVGGDNPAPQAVSPRVMDSILLDGHLGVVFQFGLALLKANERELMKLKGDSLAEALRVLPTRAGSGQQLDALLEKAFEYAVNAKQILPQQR